MSSVCAEHFLFKLCAGKTIDLLADTFKIILMANGFVYNPVTHKTYADVSASELATGNGYTQNTKTLSGLALSENNTSHWASWTANNVAWTASGGSIGPTPGAIIFDDTTTEKTIVDYIDFNGAQSAASGTNLTIASIELRLPGE